jgi:hypothetical protein
MSIVALKKKTNAQYKNMSSGVQQFSLNGTHRSQGYVGQTSLSRSLPRTLAKGNTLRGYGGTDGHFYLKPSVLSGITSTEDLKIIKPSVLSNTGMISTQYRWIDRPQPFVSVKNDDNHNTNTQQDYIVKIKKSINMYGNIPKVSISGNGAFTTRYGNYVYHVFTQTYTNNIIKFDRQCQIEYLIVAGGGAGGRNRLNAQPYGIAAGGGAGEVVSGTTIVSCGQEYPVYVGAGGIASLVQTSPGEDSSAFSIKTRGGGCGGMSAYNYVDGGSNGGNNQGFGGVILNPNLLKYNVNGLGNVGGSAGGNYNNIGNEGGGGGGGGAGGAGNPSTIGGIGGSGTNIYSDWIIAIYIQINRLVPNWSSYTILPGKQIGYIASGGGGPSYNSQPVQFSTNYGGGGKAEYSPGVIAESGISNTGGGGGGGGRFFGNNGFGGSGGSGLVIVRYYNPLTPKKKYISQSELLEKSCLNTGPNPIITGFPNELPVITTGLKAYFSLNNTTFEMMSKTYAPGSGIKYSTQNSKTGVLCNGTTYSETSTEFIQNYNISFPNLYLLMVDGLSFSLWFNPNSISSTSQILASFIDTNDSTIKTTEGFTINVNSTNITYNHVYNSTDLSKNTLSITPTNTLAINTWYHLCVTNTPLHLPFAINMQTCIYLTPLTTGITQVSTLKTFNTETNSLIRFINNSTNLLSIGTQNRLSALKNGSLPFSGIIRNFAIYNKGLTAAEVTSLYNAG